MNSQGIVKTSCVLFSLKQFGELVACTTHYAVIYATSPLTNSLIQIIVETQVASWI